MDQDWRARIEAKVDRLADAVGMLVDLTTKTNARLGETDAKVDAQGRILTELQGDMVEVKADVAKIKGDVAEVKQVVGANHHRLAGRIEQVADMLRGHADMLRGHMEGYAHAAD